MFELTEQPIDPNQLRQRLLGDSCGAFVLKDGYATTMTEKVSKIYIIKSIQN